MTSSKQETQRQAILHLWKQGIRNAIEIQSLTKIPISTVRRNLKKIQDTGDIKHKGGNGRIKKITINELDNTFDGSLQFLLGQLLIN